VETSDGENTKINRTATAPLNGVEHYCRDLNGAYGSIEFVTKDDPENTLTTCGYSAASSSAISTTTLL
jgi:hypothetical protein